MNSKFLPLALSFALIASIGVPAVANQPSVSVQVVTVFLYSTMKFTLAEGINDRGDIVGSVVDDDQLGYGFLRLNKGQQLPPFTNPDGVVGYTEALGINQSRVACGSYASADYRIHGYLRSGSVFTTYDPPGATNVFINGLNNAGDFVGEYQAISGGGYFGFINVAGTVTIVSIPAANGTGAKAINNLGTVIGTYGDPVTLKAHGFQQLADGTLIYPFDFPGAAATFPLGINDAGETVGTWNDTSGIEHGFLFEPPDTFVAFDFPGATATHLTGINNAGRICGTANRSYVKGLSFIAEVARN